MRHNMSKMYPPLDTCDITSEVLNKNKTLSSYLLVAPTVNASARTKKKTAKNTSADWDDSGDDERSAQRFV